MTCRASVNCDYGEQCGGRYLMVCAFQCNHLEDTIRGASFWIDKDTVKAASILDKAMSLNWDERPCPAFKAKGDSDEK